MQSSYKYFGDISEEEMREIMDGMEASESDLALAICESRNHEHHGELWQCTECLRLLCAQESGDDRQIPHCNDCWARVGSERCVPAFA